MGAGIFLGIGLGVGACLKPAVGSRVWTLPSVLAPGWIYVHALGRASGDMSTDERAPRPALVALGVDACGPSTALSVGAGLGLGAGASAGGGPSIGVRVSGLAWAPASGLSPMPMSGPAWASMPMSWPQAR